MFKRTAFIKKIVIIETTIQRLRGSILFIYFLKEINTFIQLKDSWKYHRFQKKLSSTTVSNIDKYI